MYRDSQGPEVWRSTEPCTQQQTGLFSRQKSGTWWLAPPTAGSPARTCNQENSQAVLKNFKIVKLLISQLLLMLKRKRSLEANRVSYIFVFYSLVGQEAKWWPRWRKTRMLHRAWGGERHAVLVALQIFKLYKHVNVHFMFWKVNKSFLILHHHDRLSLTETAADPNQQ